MALLHELLSVADQYDYLENIPKKARALIG